MHLRSGLRTTIGVVRARRNPKPRIIVQQGASTRRTTKSAKKKAKKNVRTFAGREVTGSLSAVSAPAPVLAIIPAGSREKEVPARLAPSASILEALAISALFDFLLVRDVLRLQASSRGCRNRLTGRADVVRNCDFYEFDSSYPERHAIAFWKFMRKCQTVPRNIRLRYGSAENEIVYSLLVGCGLQMLSSLSLTMVEDTPFLLCNGNRFGRFIAPQLDGRRGLVDLTLVPSDASTVLPAASNDHASTQTMEQIGVGRYLQMKDPSYLRPDLSSFCLVTHLAVAAATLTRLTISITKSMDISALSRLKLLNYLEVSPSSINDGLMLQNSNACVVETLRTVSKLPELSTFVLRDFMVRNSDPFSGKNMKDLVLKSDSLRIADFSKGEKSMVLCDVQCPRLEKFFSSIAPYGGGFFGWDYIIILIRDSTGVYVRDPETHKLTSYQSMREELGEEVVEDARFGIDTFGTARFSLYDDSLADLGLDGTQRVLGIKVVVPVRLPSDCLFVDESGGWGRGEQFGLAVDHPGNRIRFAGRQQDKPHGQHGNMGGVYV